MTTLGIDGLISGLDTTSLINSLMTAEAAPQTALKTQLSSTQSTLTDLQSLNGSIKAIADAASALSGAGALRLFTAASNSTGVTVSAGSSASAGSLALSVTQVAAAQVSVSAAMVTWPDSPPTLTVVGSDGVAHQVTAASTSMSDVAAALNAAKIGVTAVSVPAGSSGGQPQYRLQLTSSTTGAASAFSIFRGTAADVTAGTATDLLAESGAATITAASDAAVVLYGGTAAEQTITSASNTFSSLLPGVDVTVSAVTTTPATITITPSNSAVASKFGALINSLISVFSTISAKSAVTTTTNSDGSAATSGGAFTGDGTVRAAKDSLFQAISYPVGSISPSALGITITRDGTATFDPAVLASALAADPDGIGNALQVMTTRVATAATATADPFTGTLTSSITGEQSTVKQLSESISNWDDRLAARRATLEKTYAALESQLSSLKTQSSWLTSQLSSLSSGTSASGS